MMGIGAGDVGFCVGSGVVAAGGVTSEMGASVGGDLSESAAPPKEDDE